MEEVKIGVDDSRTMLSERNRMWAIGIMFDVFKIPSEKSQWNEISFSIIKISTWVVFNVWPVQNYEGGLHFPLFWVLKSSLCVRNASKLELIIPVCQGSMSEWFPY